MAIEGQGGTARFATPQSLVKRGLWAAWMVYNRGFPIQRGKYRTAMMLEALVGLPVFVVQGVQLELSPIAYIDSRLISSAGHDPAVILAIERFLGRGDVFLDVGANLGWFSLYAAVKRGARTIAFEPSPRELARLRSNVDLNKADVTIMPFGLGSSDADVKLGLAGAGNPGGNSFLRGGEDSAGVVCAVRRLDSLLDAATLERVRLVKIDVEGWELHALKGMERALPALRRAAFVVEVTPGWLASNGGSVEELYQCLESAGWTPTVGIQSKVQWDELFLPPSTAS